MKKRVRLISITTPCIDHINTAEELIVHNARVSNPSNQGNNETAWKLLRYCIKNNHWSVFEQADMTVEITTRRSISAQIIRHRSFSFQEFSQRYATAMELDDLEFRKQGATNRQVGDDVVELPWYLRLAVRVSRKLAVKTYNRLVAHGIARECARDVLPMSTSTRLYMKGSVRSWIHYLQVRTTQHTQKEHRVIAQEILELFALHFPHCYEAILPTLHQPNVKE